jgi:dihydrodipicolinate synthase/N-acetylneuraminate lyase
MSQPDFYTMCATVFAPDGRFNESAMRLYLRRQIDARLGVYLGSGGNGETHAMPPDDVVEDFADRLLRLGIPEIDDMARAAGLRVRG